MKVEITLEGKPYAGQPITVDNFFKMSAIIKDEDNYIFIYIHKSEMNMVMAECLADGRWRTAITILKANLESRISQIAKAQQA